jgi:integrase
LHLQRLYKDRQGAGLSATSVHHLHAVVHRALDQAARWGYVARNVADLVTPPRMTRLQVHAFSPEESRTLLDAAQGNRLEALYVLALSTGMRQGELLALKWADIDLDGSMIQVKATLQRTRDGFAFLEPKTAKSRRQVALTRAAVAALRRHKVSQLEERLRCPYWQDAELVFASEVGTPIEVSNLIRRSFQPLLAGAGLPRIRFHDLRHTAATLMLGQNVNVKVVSEMLGHSQIAVTLDLYSHVTPTMQRQAVEALDAVLGT